MIIKKIAKLCKRAGAVVLWYDKRHDTQWISNGSAAWPLYGMPILDTENVLTVLDIPEKDWPKITVREKALPEAYDFNDDYEAGEVGNPAVTISYGGQLLMPLSTPAGTLLVDPELFAPLRDNNQLTVHLRHEKSGQGKPYLAVKRGLLLQGIVMLLSYGPYAALPDILANLAKDLAASMLDAAEEQNEGEEADQYSIDPETGEVTEGEADDE